MPATREEMITFAKDIEKIAKDKGMNYINAIQYYCEKVRHVEFESVVGLINGPLRTKLAEEAKQLNLLRKPGKKKKRRHSHARVPSGSKRKG